MDSVYLCMSSESPYAHGVTHDFTETLPKTFWINPNQWEISLQNMTLIQDEITSLTPRMITVCCDIVNSSIIHGMEAQVLRRLVNTDINHMHWDSDQLYYMPVVTSPLTSLRLYLLDEKGAPLKVSADSVMYYTLHLRKRNTLL